MKPKVFTIIPNLNGATYLAESIESIRRQELSSNIVVVDNGSTDESVAIIKKGFPEVTVLALAKNYGFAGGVNRGITYALEQGAEYVALFNNDAVADPAWLKSLIGRMRQDERIGMVTCKFMRWDRVHIDSTGDFYTIWGFPFPRGRDAEDSGQFDAAEPIFGVTGGASLYRAAMLKQIGLFDERFFAYMEDIDISFRAQMRGWLAWYEPNAIAYHHVGATSSKMSGFTFYHSYKNFLLTYGKNMPTKLYFKYLPRFCLGAFMLFGSTLRRGHFVPLAKALWGVLVTVPHVLRERRRNLRAQTVSDHYIDGLLVKGYIPGMRLVHKFTKPFRRRVVR